jgi:hypothetical protein
MAGDDYDYVYTFPTQAIRDYVHYTLWPPAIPEAVVRRARWLMTALQARTHLHSDVLMPVPPQIRASLGRLRTVPALADLAVTTYVPRSLLSHLAALASSLSSTLANQTA